MRHLKLYCMIFTVKDKTCQKVYMQRTLLKYMIMIRAQNNNLVVAADLYFQIIIKISNIILVIHIVCRLWILRKLQLVIFCRTIIFWFGYLAGLGWAMTCNKSPPSTAKTICSKLRPRSRVSSAFFCRSHLKTMAIGGL